MLQPVLQELRRYGPAWLLAVQDANFRQDRPEFAQVADGLMLGYVAQNPDDPLNPGAWVTLCRQALAAVHGAGLSEASLRHLGRASASAKSSQ